MRKSWRPFDLETIKSEFRALPSDDWFRLTSAMGAYARDTGVGYEVKSYGDGLMMVKDSSRGQGRCLFFSLRRENGREVLTALLVYKKEGQEAPRRVIETARRRMGETK